MPGPWCWLCGWAGLCCSSQHSSHELGMHTLVSHRRLGAGWKPDFQFQSRNKKLNNPASICWRGTCQCMIYCRDGCPSLQIPWNHNSAIIPPRGALLSHALRAGLWERTPCLQRDGASDPASLPDNHRPLHWPCGQHPLVPGGMWVPPLLSSLRKLGRNSRWCDPALAGGLD